MGTGIRYTDEFKQEANNQGVVMKLVLKICSTLLLLSLVMTAEAKLAHEKTDNVYDEKYQALIIGRWIEDKEKQQITKYPGYIEYFDDGSLIVKLFKDETCTESMEIKNYWKISNGHLYYKSDDEPEWNEDRIIKMTKTHHVLRSKNEILYRKKGSVCDEQII